MVTIVSKTAIVNGEGKKLYFFLWTSKMEDHLLPLFHY